MSLVNWGDVPTWIGAIATCVGAGAVVLLAKQDRGERLQAKKAAEAKAAAQIYSEFMEAVSIVMTARTSTGHPQNSADREAWASQLKEHFLQLDLSDCTKGRDLSALNLWLFEQVRMAESACRREQRNFRERGKYSDLHGEELLKKIFEACDAIGDLVIETGTKVWEAYRPDVPPPWQDDFPGKPNSRH